jgi:hypothetical protein
VPGESQREELSGGQNVSTITLAAALLELPSASDSGRRFNDLNAGECPAFLGQATYLIEPRVSKVQRSSSQITPPPFDAPGAKRIKRDQSANIAKLPKLLVERYVVPPQIKDSLVDRNAAHAIGDINLQLMATRELTKR